MWKKAYDTAARCIADPKEYNKQRYDETHKKPDFKERDQVLVSTLNFNNPVFPNPTPQDTVEVEYSPGPVKKIIMARKIRHNGKDHRQYLKIFQNQTADKDQWLAEDAIPDGDLHLRRFRASRGAEQSHQ
ncbi:hypothetical protein O181_039888 [Austropuccinia psidii MF-1]|uniref:Uncharacterized protein n=1 Tax=Austropuccinia psidii MF-1 TaxID=1389203 RepID=A0A9Q3DG48_9BASI|nr:hypothetical protein [Austropuccinia psidii MF-1]